MIIRASGGLLERFYRDITPPQFNNTGPGGGHADDNFDVSSRLIELEELDVAKQAWKDLYGRTGIKKGYNGLFLDKIATEAYAKLATTTTEADYNVAAQRFQTVLDLAQKEAKHSFEDTYYAAADVALLSDAFVDNAAELLLKRLKEPIREVKESFVPAALIKNQPVLLVPSGALTGFNDSPMLKASLDEYVKQGGTLIVLSQKHGYDYASVPTPDGKPITGYGWEEDQNCFADSVAIESWHQLLSSQSRSTPTLNVDGYFTGYPANSTVLLRRTANGQPAMLMYEHGLGRVIVTSMYSDWAYGHGQTSQEEIALVRDMLSWTKKPAVLPEIKPGESISVPVTLTNSTATDAASIKLQIWNPDRSSLMSELSVSMAIAAGQSLTTNVDWHSPPNPALGIYHIDYLLLDSSGTVIQPQAETDSGRFVVSNPPQTGTVKKDIWLTITSPNQQVFLGEPFAYSFHIFNNTAITRNLTLKSVLPHTGRTHEWPVTAAANGETVVSGSDLFIDENMFETLRANLYDENNVEVGSYMLSFKGVFPQVTVTTAPAKPLYTRGETVNINVNLGNRQALDSTVKLTLTVTDPANSVYYATTTDVLLPANGQDSRSFSLLLPKTAKGGVYTVSSEVLEVGGKKVGGDSASFELPLSQIAVTPQLPAVWSVGNNTVTFSLLNTGASAINSGVLDVSLKDPDGLAAGTVALPFTIEPGQVKTLSANFPLPSLKFGSYTLRYAQSDETVSAAATTVKLENSVAMTASFDKPSYRIRESVRFSLGLANTGRFNSGSLAVTVSLSDAGFVETKNIALDVGGNVSPEFTIMLPATMTAGRHSLVATAALPSGNMVSKEVAVTIPDSFLAVDEPASSYQSGATANMPLRNTGGIDAAVESTFTLYDSGDRLIATKTDSGVITAGGERVIALPIPAQAADGSYRLLRMYRGPDGQLVESLRNVRINGVMAIIAAATGKQVYLGSENVSSLASIVNQGAAVDGATLDLQVLPTTRATYADSWGQDNLWKGAKQFLDTDSLPKSMQLEHYIRNGDFEYGNMAGWQETAINEGHDFIAVEGTRWSYFPTENIAINGKYAIGLRSNGPGLVSSGVVVTSDPFIPVENTLNWVQLSESSVAYLEARILDISGKILKTVPLPIVTGVFGAQQLDLSQYKGQTIRIAFMQHTYQSGFGWYTLLDDIRNGNTIYQTSGIFESETRDYGAPVEFSTISWLANTPAGTAVKFQIATNNDNATWQFVGPDGTSGSFYESSGTGISSYHNGNRYMRWRAILETANPSITPILHNLTIGASEATSRILWQNSRLISVASGATENVSSMIGTLNRSGKMALQASLKNSMGQTIAVSTYPFYVASGTAALLLSPDKALYKPGETVTISGEVRNFTATDLANLNLVIKGKPATGAEQALYTSIIAVPAGGSRPFSLTTMAGTDGVVILTANVTLNGATLAQVADQYEVASPKVTAALAAPGIAGNDSVTTTLELKNSGKVEAVITVGKSFDPQPETVTIPAGQTRLLQYSRQISADTSDSFTLSGDLTQTLTKTVKYGPAITLAVAPQALYPEGKVSLPMIVTNSGLIDSQFTVNYQLTQGANSLSQQAKSYFLAKGTSSSDSLSYDLAEGSYQLVATGQRPAASAAASFQVRKETKAELTLAVGAQNAGLLTAAVNVTNLGYLPIEGSVRLALIANDGAIARTAAQEISLPQALLPAPHNLAFSINLAPLKPGSYTIKAELLDAGNRQLASQSAPFNLLGPVIAISQLPQDRTVPAGGSSDFIFKVKNSGNQEGTFDLSFKADDLINVTRSEWLKPGEEKELSFTLQAAGDLDEKDYFASYNLRSGSEISEQGTVKYHLQGLNLAVTANLDRQAYNDGDTASFTLNVTQQDAGAAPNLFARVNYNGYNEKQSFTLNGSQTLVFNVPLTQITGEKLFYGIYTESGRSIHLNTIYVRKADAALAIATDKQVYNPGETVVATISGTAAGDLTLTGPGDFTTTFAYSDSDTRSFTLPAAMTAGTYTIKAQLKTAVAEQISATYPFDVAGIQVKVKEALLDRVKYAATDTMRLNLTIESNRDIPATVKTWIVDPAGTYTEAGSGAAALTAAAPLLTTLDAQLSTASLGIHKLVYGIYQGDLLLASGAKAFDIGEAVLLGLATDRTDYPEVTMPVSVKVDLYGTTAAGIELLLDGQSINSDSVTLSGAGLYTFVIPAASVTPGIHTLKAILSSGGLTSSRESRFTFGSTLPDLTARVAALPVSGSKMKLSVTVSNQGKTAAGESRAALFDGDPAKGGQQLALLSVPAIAAGSSATLPFEWIILGQSGEHVLYAQADSDNSVIEFIEMNNTALTAVSLPSLTLAVTAGKSAYGANEAAALTVDITNLTAGLPLENSTLKLRLTSPAGLAIDLPERNIGIIPPATALSFAKIWNSGITAPADITVTARLVSGAAELASATGSFAITPTVSLAGSIAPVVAEIPQESTLEALYAINNSGNVPIDGKLQVIIRDPQNGTPKAIQEIPLQLPVSVSKNGTFTLPLTGLEIKSYDLFLGFISATSDISVALSQFTIKDTIPPVLTVSTLSDNSYTNQETLNVSGSVHDNSGSAQVEINGAGVPVAADGSFSQALLLNMPDNSVEVKAIDMAGNKIVDSRTIHFDKTAPTLTIDTPADNSKTAVSPIEVKGSVDETSTVTVQLNGVSQPVIMDGNRFSVAVTPEPRWNTIEIIAKDLAGNPNSQKRSVLFDDQKPSLAITEPDQDIRTNKNSLTISGKASDPYSAVGVTVAIDGAILTPQMTGDSFSQIVTFTDEKLYPVVVTASNEVGTQVTAQRNIIFDRTPPNLTIDPVVTPTNIASQVVTGTREEGTTVAVSCTTAIVGAVEYPAATTWRVALSGLVQGENRLQAEACDLAGNRGTAIATIRYVPKAPEVTISAAPNQLWPPNKKLVPVRISGNVSTFGSDVKEVAISVADEYGKHNMQGLRFGDTVLLEAWREGNDMDGRVYTITAVVTDMAGNKTTQATTVIVPHDMGK